ncbi:MAG: 3-deoxy-manno-octulosonate cytidylyltransferase [Planctomycetales bacterium]|nr:3-deoxy-manno-octulosonate cytidylyltransferase [Planctomycetales bacterium]NIM09464.1 3-deoxy-manno-octulosonate cytidylyltransferase [Planctomycetales bacterium]NIN08952.1 3-deoxy-manno-octulosonate cytidylyltransferase [Planctomycetales bacterium]NIN78067.1 3-deoxy-manno-octulosonate cytidylyltransferase [Planctomycetales bacterium]NIO35245.1 3-deoxy-manno-octulosonate cytidylyltransferase [Planctomycetales bacterium]
MALAATPKQLSSYVFIPARAASTRLPEKLLLNETGKPLLQHTYEAALQASRPLGVCVAAEDDRLARAVLRFGGQVVVTGPGYASGTDRVAAVAAETRFAGIDVVVNMQGDEPELAGAAIDRVVQLLEQHPHAVMSTLATPIRTRSQLEDPSCVKVVFNDRQEAIYFSRAAIPHVRDWDEDLLSAEPPTFFQHIGLYAYRRDFLIQLNQLPPSRLEQLEGLEQLRVVEAGYSIAVGIISHAGCGIDTQSDYRRFVARQRSA